MEELPFKNSSIHTFCEIRVEARLWDFGDVPHGPHEALGYDVPARRIVLSIRAW